MQTTRPITVKPLAALCDAFNQHDLDAIMAFFADACVLEMPRGPQPWGQRFVGSAAMRGCDHWTFQDGKVIKKDSYWKIVESE
jgi:hypothetical protein